MDAQTVSQEIGQLADLASSELIDVLAKAAEDDDVWTKAASDVKGFLRNSGVEVADGAEIALDRVFVRSGSVECAPGLLRLGAPGRICTRSIQLWYKQPHLNPLPSLKLCVKWEDAPSVCVRPEDLLRR
jgi:hypothetical protein